MDNLIQLFQKGSRDFLLASFAFGGSERLYTTLSDGFLCATDIAQLMLVSIYLGCITTFYIK